MPSISFSRFRIPLAIGLIVCMSALADAQEAKKKPKDSSGKPTASPVKPNQSSKKDSTGKPAKSSEKALDKKAREKERAAKRAEVKKRFENLTDERKTELLQFVKKNHPQLEKLMKRLKNRRIFSYQQAVYSLDRDVTRLQAIEQRASPAKHKLALEEWKLKSRIDVHAVQLALKDTKEKRASLKELVGKLIDLNLKQQELEREQVAKRLAVVEQKIKELKSNREDMVDRRLKWVEKKAKDLQFSSQQTPKNVSEKLKSKKTNEQN